MISELFLDCSTPSCTHTSNPCDASSSLLCKCLQSSLSSFSSIFRFQGGLPITMNPAPTSSSAFTKENINRFRLLLIVDTVYRTFMKWVFFTDVVDKGDDETLKDYLLNNGKMTSTEYGKKFNKTMKNTIEKDKSCQSFDVSLWLCAIKYGCSSVAGSCSEEWKQSGTFENNLSRMKKIRDSLEHNQLCVREVTFREKFIEMKDLLLSTMLLAEMKYNKIDELNIMEQEYLDTINSITDYPLTAKEFKSYKQNVILQRNKEAILNKGRKELIDHHKRMSFVGALTSLLMPKKPIHVSTLFIEPDIAVLEKGVFVSISYSEMLEYAKSQKEMDHCNGAQILLIKGAAGCGKSTLMKMFLSEWGSMNNSINGLTHYEVLLFVDCRNVKVASLCKLMCLQMSQTSMRMSEKEMLFCVLSLPTLIIFDGLDEMNNNAESLLQESLSVLTNDNITIIATIRTERYDEFSCRIPDDIQKLIFCMKGVMETSREHLVMNLHEELKDQGMSGKDVGKFLQYLRTKEASLMAFFDIPFNLVLMTYLWAESSESVRTITTAVELNCRINEQIKKRIQERLVPSGGSTPTPDERIDAFINGLCWEALKGTRENAMKLSTEAIDHLNVLSESLSLHLDDMLGSFLQLDPLGEFIFFHKAQQEFLASWYIYKTVTRNGILDETENVKSKIMENFRSEGISTSICEEIETHISHYLKDYHKDGIEDILKHVNKDNIKYHLSKYQTILINIIGLFHQHESSVSKALYIEVLDLLKRSGVKDRESWITILNNVKCAEEVIKQICSRPEMKGGIANISKGNLVAYNTLINYITVDSISVNIPVNLTDVVPPFDQLIEKLVARKAPVHSLILKHPFHYPRNIFLDTSLEAKITQLVSKAPLKKYVGPLYPDMVIPPTIVNIQTSVSRSGSFARLKDFVEANQLLETLYVCVDLDINLEELSSLPTVKHWLRLYLPDVSTSSTKKAFSIIKAIAPQRDGVKEVFFPRCKRDSRVLEALMLEARKRVRDHFEYYFPSECEHFFQEFQWTNAFCGERGIDEWK